MINDFNNVTAVVDVKKYHDPSNGRWLLQTDAWKVGGLHKGYQEAKDSIGVFVNYKLVFETRSKEEARKFIKNLLGKVPKELSKEFEEFKDYLDI